MRLVVLGKMIDLK